MPEPVDLARLKELLRVAMTPDERMEFRMLLHNSASALVAAAEERDRLKADDELRESAYDDAVRVAHAAEAERDQLRQQLAERDARLARARELIERLRGRLPFEGYGGLANDARRWLEETK